MAILVVALSLPRTVPELLIRASAIVEEMGKNVGLFPKPVPSLSVVTGHIQALQASQVGVRRRTDDVSHRNILWRALIGDLHQVQAYVQQLVSASPDQAEAIAVAAAMTLRKPRSHSKADLVVRVILSGVVRAMVKAVKGAKAYEWQYAQGEAYDSALPWVQLPSTTRASTVVKGLTPGVTYHFRFRPVTKGAVADWSDKFTLIVT